MALICSFHGLECCLLTEVLNFREAAGSSLVMRVTDDRGSMAVGGSCEDWVLGPPSVDSGSLIC